MGDEAYSILVEPAVRSGMFFSDRPCLRVTVTRRQAPFVFVGSERTRREDQDEARALAAAMIARWERTYSQVSV